MSVRVNPKNKVWKCARFCSKPRQRSRLTRVHHVTELDDEQNQSSCKSRQGLSHSGCVVTTDSVGAVIVRTLFDDEQLGHSST